MVLKIAVSTSFQHVENRIDFHYNNSISSIITKNSYVTAAKLNYFFN